MTTETELKDALGFARRPPVDTADLTARLGVRAEAEGTLDLAYCEVDSPLGSLLAVATSEGLVKLGYPNVPAGEQLESLAAKLSPRMLEARQGSIPCGGSSSSTSRGVVATSRCRSTGG